MEEPPPPCIENSDFVIESIQDLVKLGTAVEKDDVPLVVSPLSVSIRSSGKTLDSGFKIYKFSFV